MLSCDNKGLDDKDDADGNENGDDKEDPDDEESDVERSQVKVKVDDGLVGDTPFIGEKTPDLCGAFEGVARFKVSFLWPKGT